MLRRVRVSELGKAQEAYLGVYAWLNAKGVRQWLQALTRETFEERRLRGELYVCRVDGQIAAVVTLAFEVSPYWLDELGSGRRWWIKTLAVARQWGGLRLGERVMQECEAVVRRTGAGEVFLDCVDTGFLPAYYRRLEYEELGWKEITYPSGYTFSVALMRKKFPGRLEPSVRARVPRGLSRPSSL